MVSPVLLPSSSSSFFSPPSRAVPQASHGSLGAAAPITSPTPSSPLTTSPITTSNIPTNSSDHSTEPASINAPKNILATTQFSNDLRILFSNINGNRIKWDQFAALSSSDHVLCINELNLSKTDCSLLTSKLAEGSSAKISALDHLSYDRQGKKVKTKRKKKKGYGTAILSKISGSTEIDCTESEHEIVYARLNLNGASGLIITGYRSPSSRVELDINSFYDAVDCVISEYKNLHHFDFIIFVGDDNASCASTSHYSRLAAKKMLTVTEKHQMIDMIEHIQTRGDRQPDSCFAFFDPEKVEIEVSALKGILKSDHEPLQILVKKSQIVAEKPKYKKIEKRYQKVTDSEVTEIMEESLACWYDHWSSRFERVNTKQLDKASNKFVDILNKVQSQCFAKKVKTVPVSAKKTDSHLDLKILQLRAQISKCAWQLKSSDSVGTRRKLNLLNIDLKKAVAKAAKIQFQEDMTRQAKLERINDSKFWQISGTLLNKAAYQTAVDKDISLDQINQKLDEVDHTFINPDPNYTPDPKAYEKVVAAPQKYKLNSDPDFIDETIQNMPRIQKFVKKNSETLKHPVSLLLRLIQKTDHFPQIFKTSKCSIIGSPPKERAIFALAPMPKIIETVIKMAFDDMKSEDGTYQMAYTKDRGTACCNLITLQEVEMCNEPTVQTLQDIVKAFNSTKHETIICEAEKKYGAGKLISSWLTNRSYTFEYGSSKQTRGKASNQGVPAGTLIGVECFLLFIATVSSLTNKNLMLLWAALYADDTSPLVKASNLVDLQAALDFSIEWAKKNNVKFHLSGSKAPTYLAYLKKGQCLPPEALTLNLDRIHLRRVFSEKILGLTRIVRNPDNPSNKTIDKYGYECQWDLVKLKQIAYRFQNIRHSIVPEFMKKLVSAYFVGYMRFSSAVIFSRCTPTHLKTARYYYCMAMAAALGLNTAEALNLGCCRHMSVGEDNSGYIRLLELTGLPSIREMACLDSCSLISQTQKIKPEWFHMSEPRVSRSQSDGKPRIIGVKPTCKGTILQTVLNLRNDYMATFKPVRDSVSKEKQKIRDDFKAKIQNIPNNAERNKVMARLYNERKAAISKVDTPVLEEYFLARSICSSKGHVNYDHLLRTFALNSRAHFNCLDTTDRFKNFKTPRRTAASTSNSDSPPNSRAPNTPTRKRRASPARGHQSAKRRRAILRCDEWVGNKVLCRFCKVTLNTKNTSRKYDHESHLLYYCTGIPGNGPLPKNNRAKPKDRMRRLAEIAAVPDPGGVS